MKRIVKRLLAGGAAVLALVGGIVATLDTVDGAVDRRALKSNDLTDLRHEALALFPRGSRLQDAAAHLTVIGFACEAMRRSLADVSAPALLCASNGRGYPDYPAINVTVSTRNGLVSDIEIWNIIARSDDDADLADAEDGPPHVAMSAAAEPNS